MFCFIVFAAYAQRDSLLLNNGDVIIGEVKAMDRGVLTIETDYSDSDFKIEWEKIKRIYTESYFLITLSDGKRFNGSLSSTDSVNVNIIVGDIFDSTTRENIVYLKSVDSGFWSRLYASVDLGYSLTRANSLRQFNVRSNIGYLAERWSADANYNNVYSSQDDVEDIHRIDAGLTYRFFLPNDYFLLAQISWLSNTEQSLALRTTSKLGLGRYLIHTNQTYWGVQAGVSFNNENFSNETSSRRSGEGFVGTELNMYDVGDLNLLTNVVVYPSLTESKRWRVDYTFDLKYDLPLDFYIKLGFTLNYDNQPADNASTTDYVIQTSFGWEL
ncbi:DUF481 domain-containing protein [Catalinimonas sp. 4WD22]|uniref:DUF481 domain-containing protein n=1 Tax=Catalinimonas locisalis TaxID=3133978 RepID=UPI0031012C6A